MASPPSPSQVLTSGASDYDTAPESASLASSPETYFSFPSSPTLIPASTPITPRVSKKVSWSPLPPKMDRTPTRSTSTPQLPISDAPITLQNVSPLPTPTQPGRSQGGPLQSPLSRAPQQLARFEILPGNPLLPLDICADGFLKTKKFEVICTVAMNIACMIPTDPPPQTFVSLDVTPMHSWFESLVAVFTECFAKRLRDRDAFPIMQTTYATDGSITVEEDHAAFENELVAHVNAIFRSFNVRWALRPLGSYEGLLIDTTQPRAGAAAMAIREATEKASFPPKANWKVGETLHPFYRQQLRRFRGGVVRLIEERLDLAWLLTVPEQLERGVGGYEEYYIAHVRQKILVHNGEA